MAKRKRKQRGKKKPAGFDPYKHATRSSTDRTWLSSRYASKFRGK